MKSKFISPILAIAVVVGMALVPLAVPGQVALASGNVTVAIEPSTTHVLPNGSFTIDAVIDNPSAMPVAMHNVRLNFDPNYFTVDSASLVDFDTEMTPVTINNTAGHLDWDPMMTTGTNTTDTWIVSARINCTAKSLVGTSTISWVYTSGPPPRYTKVVKGTTDYLEGGNMSLMFNGTVVVGTPQLTVNVTPAGKGTVKANGVTLTGYPNTTTRSWDALVSLEAVNSTPGYGFVSWTGNLTGSTNPTSITMNATAKNVTANFAELPPKISPVPTSLTFNGNVGGNVTNKTLDIYNGGGGILNWTANITGVNATWLSMSPMSGGNLAAAQFNATNVAVNTTGLTEGTYHANITISGAVPDGTGNAVNGVLITAVTVPVTLNLGVPEISASPIPLTFTTNEGENPADKTLEVCNSGTGTLNWSLTDNAAWLSETPTSGSLDGDECEDVTVSVAASELAAGDYSATITITGSPTLTIPVSLSIEAAGAGIPGAPGGIAPPVEPAQLKASGLHISPQQVKPGQEVTISINVANSGGETGSYNAVLYINGVAEASQTVSVAPGMTKNVIFAVSKSDAGVYDVSIAGQNGQFEVVHTGWFGGGLGTSGIIVIVVIVIVLILALVFVLRGTRRAV